MDLLDFVNIVPMCQNFSTEEKKLFASMDHSLQGFNHGDTLIKEGDQYSCLYLLVKGTLLVTKGGLSPTIAELKQGTIFGEMSYFTKRPRHTNVIASSRVLVIKMDNNFFKKITPEMKDKIKNYFIELLINRLDSMNDSLIKISKFAKDITQPIY